jgi:hypothetical protein
MTEKFSITVNSIVFKFNGENETSRNILDKFNSHSLSQCDLLVQIFRGGERKILLEYESVDLSSPGVERFEAFHSAQVNYFMVNEKKFITDKVTLHVNSILEIAGLFPVTDYKLSLLKNESENLVLSKEEEINVRALANPHFRADLKDRIYTIQVDGVKHVFEKEKVTMEQILLVAGKTPVKNYELIQKFHDKRRVKVTPEMWVDLATVGTEKFVTIDCAQREGAR